MQQVVGSPPGSRVSDPFDPLAAGSGSSGGSKSAASWSAIFAGAFVAIAASAILLAFGSGLGFAMVSPWPGHGASATAFTVNAAIWLIVSQWLSAALGGYIAGRLRTKWVGTHTHEVFFRDTAHGLVTWSVATVAVAALLAGSVTSGVGGASRALGGAASAGLQGAASGAAAGPPGPPGMPGGPSAAMTYDIDKLFRPAAGGAAHAAAGAAAGSASNAAGSPAGGSPAPGMDMSSDPRVEAVYIALHAVANPRQGVPDDDRAYLAQLVQAQTGVSPAEAQKRVDDFVTATINAENKARAAVDAARKAAAEASIFTALALLVGAFIASVSAALGGRLRDEHL
jgi:hypothetical protein